MSDESDKSDEVGPCFAKSASEGKLVDGVEAKNLRAGLNRFFIKFVLVVNGFCLLSHYHREKL